MKYIITFKFMDGETLEVDVSLNKLDDLMNSISKSKVYFDDDSGAGMWLSMDKVRYFHIEKVDDKGKRVVVKKGENDPAWNEVE